jgi:hypothetical protein
MAYEKAALRVEFSPCCFCGINIVTTDIDPCSVQVSTRVGKWQVWFCHAKCFKERIAAQTEIDLSPAYF